MKTNLGRGLTRRLNLEKLEKRITLDSTVVINEIMYHPDNAIEALECLLPGDFNRDGIVDAVDIDRLAAAVQNVEDDLAFDLTGDGIVDANDRVFLVNRVLRTSFGDSNLDGVFDSRDLVLVFQQGEYEDSVSMNSTWIDGDWDGDGEFATSDLVLAFQSGAYSFDVLGESIRPKKGMRL